MKSMGKMPQDRVNLERNLDVVEAVSHAAGNKTIHEETMSRAIKRACGYKARGGSLPSTLFWKPFWRSGVTGGWGGVEGAGEG